MARKVMYRGLEAEALKSISVEDYIKIAPSHQRRTLRRMGTQVKKFIKHFRDNVKKGRATKTHFRNMPILPEMIGHSIKVHAGNVYADVTVTPEMLGHRLGEFAITTKLVKHSGPGVGATRGSKAVELK
jgi:small subunit ribosomal protein S19